MFFGFVVLVFFGGGTRTQSFVMKDFPVTAAVATYLFLQTPWAMTDLRVLLLKPCEFPTQAGYTPHIEV